MLVPFHHDDDPHLQYRFGLLPQPLIHAAQRHCGSTPRFMAQPPLHPAEPFRLDRENGDYSPVEMAIRRALQQGSN